MSAGELNVYKNRVAHDPDGLSEADAVREDLIHFLATMPPPKQEAKGGEGSGNFGHEGRPGLRGGSSAGGGIGKVLAAQVRAQGGFTYNPLEHNSPKSGYVVAIPRDEGLERVYSKNTFKGERAKQILKQFVTEVRDGIKKGEFSRNTHVGAWVDNKTNRVVLDASEVYENEKQALKIGKQRQQDAIYQIGVGDIDLRGAKQGNFSFVDRRGNGRRVGLVGGGDDGEVEAVKGGAGSGNFGHSGRPGLVGGSDSNGGPVSANIGAVGRSYKPSQSLPIGATDAITQQLHELSGAEVIVAPNANAVRAAAEVASTLEEIQGKGYVMPDQLTISAVSGGQDAIAGRTTWYRPSAFQLNIAAAIGEPSLGPHTDLTIMVPENLPPEISLDKAVELGFGGKTPPFANRPNIDKFAVRSMKDIFIHELAHVQDGPRANNSWVNATTGNLDTGAAVRSVSNYANDSPSEFIAEAFVKLYRGETLSPESKRLFDALGGKYPKKSDSMGDKIETCEGFTWPNWSTEEWLRRAQESKFNPNHAPAGSSEGGQFTSSDGSTSASSEAAAAVADKILANANTHESEVTALLKNIVSENGGQLNGLEFKLKTKSSLTRKLISEAEVRNVTPDQVPIGDALRYTAVFNPDKFASGAQATLDEFRNHGFKVVGIHHYWEGLDYRGTNTKLSKYGLVFELQFHTPESYKVKEEKSHPIYEELRVLPSDSPKRAALTKALAAIWMGVAVPIGAMMVKTLRHWPSLHRASLFQLKEDTKLRYYKSDDGSLLLIREVGPERYEYLNSAGKWKDGSGFFEKYFFNGELGLEEIDQTEAESLARKFGSSLDAVGFKGGEGSGNFSHAGRPGEVGGSAPNGTEPWQQSRDEYAPHPYSKNPDATDEELNTYHERANKWEQSMYEAVSLGKITPEEAGKRGFYYDKGWKPLPDTLYHVTTAADAVENGSLKSRYELGQGLGAGLGGGDDKTISFTESLDTAKQIAYAMNEAHEVAAGIKTPQTLLQEAKDSVGAPKPFYNDIMRTYDNRWQAGEQLPIELDALLRGQHVETGNLGDPPRDRNGPLPGDWKPSPRDEGWQGADKRYYSRFERPMTLDEKREAAFSLYQKFAFWRDAAGGRLDPLFFLSDHEALAQMNPNQIAVMQYKPSSPNSMGTRESALGEWRTGTGKAVTLVKRNP